MSQSWLSDDEVQILTGLGELGSMLQLVLTEQRVLSAACKDIDSDIDALAPEEADQSAKLDQILQVLTQSPGTMKLAFGTPVASQP